MSLFTTLTLFRHLGLGKLIFIYDDNAISIDGSTDLAFTENVIQRFEAYGFHCQSVEDGDSDLEGIAKAIDAARAVKDRPSLIKVRTTIGFSSKQQGTEKVHGAPLGPEDLAQVKKGLGFADEPPFTVSEKVYAFYQKVVQSNKQLNAEWDEKMRNYSRQHQKEAEELMRRLAKKLPDDLYQRLPRYKPGTAEIATRKLSETVLNTICDTLPELIGGSADLTHSNLTKWKDSADFQRPGPLGNYSGRFVRFGVREHAMFGICNGMAAYNGLIPFASTFLNFISYGLGSVRLSALSHQQVLYIMTHDSIGLGEDGPTHQPIETLAGLRALPNCLILRPADGNEVSGAYWQALIHRDRPSVLCLSRQNLPQLPGTSVEGVAKGAYVISQSNAETSGDISNLKKPDLILIGTGSELSICQGAADKLHTEHGLVIRVVSMPSWELYEGQSVDYRRRLFVPDVPIISVEALSTLGWERYAHFCVGMRTFGSSGPYQKVYEKFGFTPEAVVQRALSVRKYYQSHPIPDLLSHPQP